MFKPGSHAEIGANNWQIVEFTERGPMPEDLGPDHGKVPNIWAIIPIGFIVMLFTAIWL